ncbi:hypothetical protein HYH03_015306 [Edaphochlamys debaryana]|uniref:Alginate lyase 2 domain-containing protein n=1 Tax=Edaphochlamys debaryana TaxID=47281 RepID=A0A836BSP3_9CHLO|nr:hypothetical protein HYH03_015306 [Edaphochlamys debaryana]|eukprot:KAG2485983.1 hypothetical protein HYH03_015306 [Edaphochlamys debaryana]
MAHQVATKGCPPGWSPAVGTPYDAWPKPGTKECVQYSGCKWAGMFNSIDGGGSEPGSCRNGAQWLDGGMGDMACRIPESLVRSWSMAATYDRDRALLGRRLEVMVEGAPERSVVVEVMDVCSDDDCDGCCRDNTGDGRWRLIDLEKWPASQLLGFSPAGEKFDININKYPYDLKLSDRYSLTPLAGGDCEHRMWVYDTDKPFKSGSTTEPRTEMRIRNDYTSGVHSISFQLYVPSGTTGASVMQVFGGTGDYTTSLQLRVYDGKLLRYNSQILEENVHDRWIQINVAHDVKAHSIKIVVAGKPPLVVADRGTPAAGHYFKLGVYGQDGSSSRMEARYRSIQVL